MALNDLGASSLLKNSIVSNSDLFGGASPRWRNGPWDDDKSLKEDPFWQSYEIVPGRWTGTYPYRLLVVEPTDDGAYKIVGGGQSSILGPTLSYFENGGGFSLQVDDSDSAWVFTLPITPQSITIQDQYAINTVSTFRGVLEEHNGVKFKMINLNFNNGVFNKRETIAGNLGSSSLLGSVFAGTIEKFNGVLDNVAKVASSFTGSHPSGVGRLSKPSSDDLMKTGYYKTALLSQFLEKYAIAKKNPKNKNWRLAIDMVKDGQTLLVSPMAFSTTKNVQNPVLTNISLQLKAWKRIKLDGIEDLTDVSRSFSITPNLFQSIIQTISNVRNLLSSAINLVKAVRSDFQRVFNILRQTALAIKDLSNLVFSIADLPRQVIKDLQNTIRDSMAILKSSFKRGVESGGNTSNSIGSGRSQPIRSLIKSASVQNKTSSAISSAVSLKTINEGLSADQVSQGALGNNSANLLKVDPLNEVFDTPEEYFDLFDNINLDNITLSPAQQEAFQDELENIRLITVDDFRVYRQEMVSLASDLANNFGAGDATVNALLGKPAPKTRITPMTLEENEILTGIYEMVQVYDSLIATTEWDKLKFESPMQYVGGVANQSGVNFNDSTSKFLAPVPFGLTIEQISARYLESADRWIEIATLNGLRSPYIDEEGFSYNLISNGSGRQLNVDDSATQLYIGQKITLRSLTIAPFVRKVVSIEKISDNNYLVNVDGLANLDILTTSANASIRGYLPGTVNSQNQIYIPSNQPFAPDDNIRRISHLDEDELTKISKVDFLLTEDGDIALNQLGDIRLASGMTNLIQAIKIKIQTEKGTLLKHPKFGLNAKQGVSLADLKAGVVLDDLNQMIRNDGRYSRISRMDIRIVGPSMYVDMAVEVANGNGVLPITFKV